MPIKCWIHTHPFGKAYFSGTDWNTINTYEPIMDSAIVLGGVERMTWIKGKTDTHFEIFVPQKSTVRCLKRRPTTARQRCATGFKGFKHSGSPVGIEEEDVVVLVSRRVNERNLPSLLDTPSRR